MTFSPALRNVAARLCPVTGTLLALRFGLRVNVAFTRVTLPLDSLRMCARRFMFQGYPRVRMDRPGGNRTHDAPLIRRALYTTELRATLPARGVTRRYLPVLAGVGLRPTPDFPVRKLVGANGWCLRPEGEHPRKLLRLAGHVPSLG